MKFALAFALTFGAPADRPRDPWFGADKVKHFATSAVVQAMSYGAIRATNAGHRSSLVGATAVTMAAGVGKELHDRRAGGPFSLRDLAWDAAGAGAATAVLVRTER